MKISVVDQSPIFSNTDANQALIDSIELAKLTDSYGLHRYWVAEHHGLSLIHISEPTRPY